MPSIANEAPLERACFKHSEMAIIQVIDEYCMGVKHGET